MKVLVRVCQSAAVRMFMKVRAMAVAFALLDPHQLPPKHRSAPGDQERVAQRETAKVTAAVPTQRATIKVNPFRGGCLLLLLPPRHAMGLPTVHQRRRTVDKATQRLEAKRLASIRPSAGYDLFLASRYVGST
jgi:hypothetical protein